MTSDLFSMKCMCADNSVILNFATLYTSSITKDLQFSYRSGKSTISALFGLIHGILELYETKCSGRFYDLTKAFETVNYDLLIRKLE